MTPEECYQNMLNMRRIETPCTRCQGWGVIPYSSTATWRGGICGNAITYDVCNRCWGSGNAHRAWPSHHTPYSEQTSHYES